MALVTVNNFTGRYYGRQSITGAPNLRASHSFAYRVKHASTATNYDSICCWFSSNGTTGGSSGSWSGRNMSGVAATELNFYRGAGVDTEQAAGCYGTTNTWYHVAFVYNATSQVYRLYVDGVFIVQRSSVTTSSSSSTSNQFGIGWHNGKFADAVLYSTNITDQDVADLAAYRVPLRTSNLLLYWPLDSNGNDASGNGQTAAITNTGGTAPTFDSDAPPQLQAPIVGGATTGSTLSGSLTKIFAVAGAPTTSSTLSGTLSVAKPVAGDATTASTLSGALGVAKQLAAAATTSSQLAAWLRPRWGRRVSSTPAFSRSSFGLSTAAFTVMGWVKHINLGTGTGRINLTGSSTAIELGGVSSTAYIRVADSGGDAIAFSTSDAGDWHHFAVTYDGATALAYLDGSQVASAAWSPAATLTNFNIENAAGSGIVEVAHVKIWTAVLSASEIVSEGNYYTPHTANTQLYGWWPLTWQSPGADASGNGRTLTVGAGDGEAQSESPGLPLTDLAGAASSATTLAGTLSVHRPLEGGATSSSALAGTLSQAQPLVGGAASASSLAGTLSLAQPLAGAAASSSSLSGTLSQEQPLVAAAATSSTLTGSLDVSVPLAGAASSASALAGTLGVHRPIEGALSTGSTLTGALGIEGAFSGNALTASTLAGTLSVDKPIAGAASTASTLTGILSQLQPLGAAALTSSALSGAITVIKQAEGAASTASSLTGALSVAVALAGSPSTASSLSGTLTLTQQLAAAAQSSSTLTGTLTVQNVLSGAAATASQLAGTLSIGGVVWPLVAAARTASMLTGSLTVIVPASARGSVVTRGKSTAYYGPTPISSPGIRRPWPPRPR